MDLVLKMTKPDFFKNAKAADYLGKIWELLCSVGAGDGDSVLDAILALYLALLHNDVRDVTTLSAREDFIPTIIRVLAACQDCDQLGALENLSNFELSQRCLSFPLLHGDHGFRVG